MGMIFGMRNLRILERLIRRNDQETKHPRLSSGVFFRQNVEVVSRLMLKTISCRTFCVFVRLSGKHLPNGRDVYYVALVVIIAYSTGFVNHNALYLAKVASDHRPTTTQVIYCF